MQHGLWVRGSIIPTPWFFATVASFHGGDIFAPSLSRAFLLGSIAQLSRQLGRGKI
jgi:hypothetical protein